ncbi:PilX N-terminal domain-containing pilus assembly protein [Chitinibacter sp. ZOR0017]|uniref:PilX N-terminal domain-containing pilus assembly protein n=1 Tax=Chitinibacter sp. ZOR0017 TaxID=1339254 RepID=UPI0006455038|nr:PilX N-terminal domain-containing pilus assembly protein [Chitinibacter sp. ZOR0017]
MVHDASANVIAFNKQRGVATLLVSIFILLILGVLTLYTNRSVIIEQRSASNEYKQAQALEAAQAGLARFMAQLSGTDPTTNWQAYFSQSGSTLTLNSSFDNQSRLNAHNYINSDAAAYKHDTSNAVSVSNVDTTLVAPKDNTGASTSTTQAYKIYLSSTATPNRFILVSRGCADTTDCGYAAAFVTTEFTVAAQPACALDINGAATVNNGSSIHALLMNDTRFNCGVSVGSITGVGGGLGQVTGCQTNCQNNPGDRLTPNYSTTGTASKQEHFEKYFPGKTMSQLLNERTTQAAASPKTACVITPPSGSSASAADLQNCLSQGQNRIFVNGNLDTGTTAIANFGYGENKNGITGVEVVVNGDFTMNSSVGIWGFLYVGGNTLTDPVGSKPAGSLRVDGTAAFGGNVSVNASLGVYVQPGYARNPNGGSVQANLALGSWRDF